MGSSSKNNSFNSECFFMSISRQRRVENSTVFESSSMVVALRKALIQNVDTSFDENEYFGINSLLISKLEEYDDCGKNIIRIKLITKKNKNDIPVYIAIAFLEQVNAFLMVQGSVGSLLSSQSLETFINHLFSEMQIELGEEYTYFIKLKRYSTANPDLKQEQTRLALYAIVEDAITQGYKQISLFEEKSLTNPTGSHSLEKSQYSEDVYNDFEISSILMNYHSAMLKTTYKALSTIVPKEVVQFTSLLIEQAVVCEMICSAICHQMNWDFLRSTVLKKTLTQPNWIEAIKLSTIQTKEVEELFKGYAKVERIRAEERADLLRILGTTFVSLPRGFSEIFFQEDGTPQDVPAILNHLSSCTVFSNDPVEKKIQLLLQKLSVYKGFKGVGNKCKPTIDYHIIRSFLRRGFLVPKTKYAREIVTADAIRAEQTVGAIRKHCAEIITLLSEITGQSIAIVNNIEWWLGRSICIEDHPLCDLGASESEWLLPRFNTCPFRNVFCKSGLTGMEPKQYSAPNYRGDSY